MGQVKEVLQLDHRGLKFQFTAESPVKADSQPSPKDTVGVHLKCFK